MMDNELFIQVHAAMGQYWAELARMFADSPILPINVSDYARQINDVYVPDLRNALLKDESQSELKIALDQLDFLVDAARRFVKSADECEQSKDEAMNTMDQIRILGVNERLMAVDRCFVNPRGLPGNPTARHVLLYGKALPGVYDQLNIFRSTKNKAKRQSAVKRLAEQISIVQYSIECAINHLAIVI